MSRKNRVEDLWIYDDDDVDENALVVGGSTGLEFDIDAIMAGLGDVRSDDGDSSLADNSAYNYGGLVSAPKTANCVDSETESLYNSSTGGDSTVDDEGTFDVDRAMSKQKRKGATTPVPATVDAPLDGLAKVFHRMESQTNWEEVGMLLQLNPSYSFESHYGTEAGDEGTYYKRLPLHHACRWNAPFAVIGQLLILNPGGALTRDAYSGVLPIHLACRYGSAAAVAELLGLPSAEDVINMAQHTDDMGRLPLHWACRSNGNNNTHLPTPLLLKLVQAYPAAVTQRDRARCKTPLDYAREHPILRQEKPLQTQMLKIRVSLSREQQRTLLMEAEQQATERDYGMTRKDEEDDFDVIPLEIYDVDKTFSMKPKNEDDDFDVIPAKLYVEDDMKPKYDTDEFDVIPANLYVKNLPPAERLHSQNNIKARVAGAATEPVNSRSPPPTSQKRSSMPTTRTRSNRSNRQLPRAASTPAVRPSAGAPASPSGARGPPVTVTKKYSSTLASVSGVASTNKKIAAPHETPRSGVTTPVIVKKKLSAPVRAVTVVRSSSPPTPTPATVNIKFAAPPTSPPPPPPTTRPPTNKLDGVSCHDSSTPASSGEVSRGRHILGSPRSVMDMMGGAQDSSPMKQSSVAARKAAASSLAYPPIMSNSSGASSTASSSNYDDTDADQPVVVTVDAKFVPKATIANSKPSRRIYSKRQGKIVSTVHGPTAGMVVEKVQGSKATKQEPPQEQAPPVKSSGATNSTRRIYSYRKIQSRTGTAHSQEMLEA